MRSFTIIDCDQRSEKWRLARAGKLTASRAADVLAQGRTKGTEAVTRKDLKFQLVTERLTGLPEEDTWTSRDMDRGTLLEPYARSAYEALTGTLVTSVGFLAHTEMPIGYSPDGIIGDFEGVLEIKCPKSATHMEYWRDGKVPAKYRPQLLHALLVTGAEYADFVSYDPRFGAPLDVFLVRLERDDRELGDYRDALLRFLGEVDREYQSVLTMINLRGQLERALETA